MDRDLPDPKVGLSGEGHLHISHPEFVCLRNSLEDFDALGILYFDGHFAGKRLELRVQRQGSDQYILPGFVDGFVRLQKEECTFFHSQDGFVLKPRTLELKLILPFGDLGYFQVDDSTAIDKAGGLRDLTPILHQNQLDRATGRLLSCKEGHRNAFGLA